MLYWASGECIRLATDVPEASKVAGLGITANILYISVYSCISQISPNDETPTRVSFSVPTIIMSVPDNTFCSIGGGFFIESTPADPATVRMVLTYSRDS